ncbi:Hsp20/alpha crystallin family protein [Thermaurantiacus sp.]
MDLKSLIPHLGPAGTGLSADPFAAMRREMDRMFEEFSRAGPLASGFLSPRVDVAETDSGLEIHAELPGIEPKDVDLELDDGVLTLKAETSKTREEKDEKKKFHLVERASGTYFRRFAIPFLPDEAGIKASFDKGVLTVTVPRAAEAKPTARKISIG